MYCSHSFAGPQRRFCRHPEEANLWKYVCIRMPWNGCRNAVRLRKKCMLQLSKVSSSQGSSGALAFDGTSDLTTYGVEIIIIQSKLKLMLCKKVDNGW